MSGAEIAFIYQRCEWHNGFLCTLPVKSTTAAELTSVFPHVSWFSVSFQSSTGHSVNTTLSDFFELPCVNHTYFLCFLVSRENKLALFGFGCLLQDSVLHSVSFLAHFCFLLGYGTAWESRGKECLIKVKEEKNK